MTNPTPTQKTPIVISNPWEHLKHFTDARIALGRVGSSLPTQRHLEFQSAHASARDAVKLPLNWLSIQTELVQMGLDWLQVHSQASDRLTYLQRPDLGRLLLPEDEEALKQYRNNVDKNPDITLVVADGLSSQAIQENAIGVLNELIPTLKATYSIAPIILAEQARVALGDEIGQALNSQMVIMLIGERPGLSAANSMGIYLTYKPTRSCLDSERNCLSNIRSGGMSYPTTVEKICYLLDKAFRQQMTGVGLKEEQNVLEQRSGSEGLVRKMLGIGNKN